MHKHLFISDLHLSPERPEIIQLFIQFINNQASKAHSLYILGDLVEYWPGDDDKAEGLSEAFNCMKEQADKGLKIYLMHGNRDFLMGEALARRAGCTLITDPCLIEFNDTPVLLMHGDTLCTDDIRYQAFRAQLRSQQWKEDFLSKPLAEREQIAQGLRNQSRAETQNKTEDIMDANADAIIQAFSEHRVALMIHGHTHRPAIHRLTVNEKPAKRIVLGDWYSQGSVLEFTDPDTFELKSFAD
ncbi:UDP-2,3-diacylglucosamine diphosphatase [hydrothermal vent metagenome]|uniref:UDP-2,3-diacylglucosamine diphosphatase n=1 Tax=hydrothermal vent metagenome TaxID=652676 RepID=A0A3B0X674_9ZZZZ